MVARAVADWVAAPVATTVTGAGGDEPELAAPVNTSVPTTSGDTIPAGTRNGAIGTWTGNPAPTYSYQWQRDELVESWVDMPGETAIDWLINDIGSFRLAVTATNSEDSATAYSASFSVANPVQNGTVGSTATDGGGNWGFSANRAMGNIFTLTHTATLKQGGVYIIPASGSGSTPLKQCVYTNVAGAAGVLLAVSLPTVVSAGGVVLFEWEDQVIAPQEIHILVVADTVGGAGWDIGSFDSGGLPAAQIYNGTIDYASPTTPAPAPDAQYNNGLSTFINYEY